MKVTNYRRAMWPLDDLEIVGICPCCGSDRRREMYGDLYDDVFQVAPGKWTLWHCMNCSCAYLDPRPTKSSIGRAYSYYYTHQAVDQPVVRRKGFFRATIHDLLNGYANQKYGLDLVPNSRLGRFLVPLIPPLRSAMDADWRHMPMTYHATKHVLDVGCGNGGFLDRARRAGWIGVGIDPDNSAVAVCRSRGLNVVADSAENLGSFKSATFDLITLSHVIEHVHDPRILLDRVFDLLRPGGTVWIETPNLDSFGHRKYTKHWRGLEAPRHLVMFNRESLVRLIEQAGFSRIAWKSHGLISSGIFAASEAAKRGELAANVSRNGRPSVTDLLAETLALVWPRSQEYLTVTALKPGLSK